jgi:hypothetical protein
MSRAINLSLGEADVLARCETESVGVSAIERLPRGGVRLVCMSIDGAELIKRKLKSHIIKGDVTRERHRPTRPLW